jgi:hypothetical protein
LHFESHSGKAKAGTIFFTTSSTPCPQRSTQIQYTEEAVDIEDVAKSTKETNGTHGKYAT